MERSGVIVLALVSFVTGTPYGYGVKSGAVAKAEANSASGAFAVPAIPLSIPSGGFSGSFSKSSSSSFASASSSASSSSSSYSFSGSNGIPGFGCISNDCKNGVNLVPSTLHGSSSNGVQSNGAVLSGATAGAIAGANAFAGIGASPCQGNCNGVSQTTNKCSSGECQLHGNEPATSNGASSSGNYNSGSNCALGQCGPAAPSSNYPTRYESSNNNENFQTDTKSSTNDFTLSPGRPTRPGPLNKLNENNYGSNIKNEYGEIQPDCSQGKCEHSSSSTKPSDKNDIFIPLSPSATGVTQTSKTPDRNYVSPNSAPACTSHNCNIAPTGPYVNTEKLPSSYNVPILGNNPSAELPLPSGNSDPSGISYDLPKQTSTLDNCDGGICGSNLGAPTPYPHQNSINSVSSIPHTNPTRFPNLGIQTGTFDATKSTSTNIQHNQHLPSRTPGLNQPTEPLNGNVQHTSLNIPRSDVTPTTENIKKYTGGFGGPAGFIETNHSPQTTFKPSLSEKSPTPKLPHYNGISDTTGANSLNVGSDSYSDSHGTTKPSNIFTPSNQHTPISPGNYAGSKPSGTYVPTHQTTPTGPETYPESKPVDNSVPNKNIPSTVGTNVGSKPSDNLVPPHQNTPASPGNYPGTKPIDNLVPSYQNVPSGPGSHAGSPHQNTPTSPGTYGGSKPSDSLAPPHQSVPSGLGSYAGSTYQNRPSMIDTYAGTKPSDTLTPPHQNVPTGPGSYAGSPHQNAPSGPGTYAESKPSDSLAPPHQNVHTGPGSYAGTPLQNAPTSPETHAGSKPSDNLIPPHQNVPTGQGSYAGPKTSGSIVPPNQYYPTGPGTHGGSIPSAGHISTYQNTPTALGFNAGSKPSGSLIPPHQHVVTGSETYPGSKPSTSPVPDYNTSTGSGASTLKSSGEEAYTGGFGGPTGLLKPNDYSFQTNPSISSSRHYNPTSCISISCKKENIPTDAGTRKGTLANEATAIANAKAVVYTGGFGGPSGFLKPFDNNRQSKSGQYDTSGNDQASIQDNSKSDSKLEHKAITHESSNHRKSETGVFGGSQANAGTQANSEAQANAVAFASSSAITANDGNGSSGCQTGCGSNYGSGIPSFVSSGSQAGSQTHAHNGLAAAAASANSVAGAGTFGSGKSIASSSATAHAAAGAAVKGYGR